MGVNVLTSPTSKKIVIPNITTGATVLANTKIAKTVIVPKGVYSVNLIKTGGAFGGSSTGYATSYLSNTSIVAYDASNGRPLSFYNGTFEGKESANQYFHIIKDSYLQINIAASPTAQGQTFEVILEPAQTVFNLDFAFTPNTGTTAGTTNSADVGVAIMAMGYDYDSDSPLIITSGTGTSSGRGQRYTSSFALWRRNASTGAWSKKTFTTSSATGFTWYQGNGIVIPNTAALNGAGFFIKNNILHNLTHEGWMTEDATSHRYGWIKADVSVASGSNIPFSVGLSDTAFGQTSSDISSSTNNIMLYWHDIINKKVIYNGSRSGTYNGSYSGYPWLHKWGQYDIPTATIEYAIDNGTIDPRLQVSSDMAYTYAIPNVSTGRSYTVSPNGGTVSYLSYWDRSANKTNVGNCTSYRSNSPSQGNLQPTTNNCSGIFLGNGDFYLNNAVSSDLFTGRNLLYDINNIGNLLPVSNSLSTNSSYTQIMHTPNKLYVLQSGYVLAANSDASGPYYTAILQLLSAPVNDLTSTAVINKHGGTPTAALNYATGTNPLGTW
jgi:hypothetical protein